MTEDEAEAGTGGTDLAVLIMLPGGTLLKVRIIRSYIPDSEAGLDIFTFNLHQVCLAVVQGWGLIHTTPFANLCQHLVLTLLKACFRGHLLHHDYQT